MIGRVVASPQLSSRSWRFGSPERSHDQLDLCFLSFRWFVYTLTSTGQYFGGRISSRDPVQNRFSQHERSRQSSSELHTNDECVLIHVESAQFFPHTPLRFMPPWWRYGPRQNAFLCARFNEGSFWSQRFYNRILYLRESSSSASHVAQRLRDHRSDFTSAEVPQNLLQDRFLLRDRY